MEIRGYPIQPARVARWSPFVMLALWLVYSGVAGQLRLDLGTMLLAGLVWVCWLFGAGLWPLALLMAVALTPLAWHQTHSVHLLAGQLSRHTGSYIRIAGTVRDQQLTKQGERPELWLLLGESRLEGGGQSWRSLEVEVRFAVSSSRFRPLYRRRLRIGGRLAGVEIEQGRLRLTLAGAEYHRESRPIEPQGGEFLRMALRDRAAYYLGKPALAAYLPVMLGMRERRSPEAREVVGAVRRVGISHLFAISGLHIGLIFVILLATGHFLLGFLLRGQGWLRSRTVMRLAIMALIWAYIALIGFPVPAVRAAVMGSMLLWSDLWGTRTPRLYVLLLAGLILTAVTPTSIYDISFQLSFLAYFFLLWALELPGRFAIRWEGPRTLGRRIATLTGMNLWITLIITLGIWPVIAFNFGNISLLVFLGNLLMVPLLSVVVLPSGMVALLVSLLMLGQPPGGWLERAIFGWMELVLSGWLMLVKAIEGLGGELVFSVKLNWGAREFFLYYAGLTLLLILLRYPGYIRARLNPPA